MTAAISKKDLDMQIKILKADRNRQIPVAVKALEGLRRAEEKYHFEFQSIGIDEEFEKLRKDTPTESIVEQFVGLEYSVHIQAIYPFPEEIALICNEEGKLEGLPLNRALRDEAGKIYDIISGTFFLCAAPADSENFTRLNEEQIEKYTRHFHQPEMFLNIHGHLACLPIEEPSQ